MITLLFYNNKNCPFFARERIIIEQLHCLIIDGRSLLTNDDDHIHPQIDQFQPFGLSEKGGGKGGFYNHVNITIIIVIDVVVITIISILGGSTWQHRFAQSGLRHLLEGRGQSTG